MKVFQNKKPFTVPSGQVMTVHSGQFIQWCDDSIVQVLCQGDIFEPECILSGQSSPYKFESIGISQASVGGSLSDPETYRRIRKQCAAEMIRRTTFNAAIRREEALGKVRIAINYLASLKSAEWDRNGNVTVRFSRSMVGQVVGVSREMVGRVVTPMLDSGEISTAKGMRLVIPAESPLLDNITGLAA